MSEPTASGAPVRYELNGPVAWITMDRPERRNALSAEVRHGLREAFDRFNTDEAAAVAVLTGAGQKAFCAGGDLQEMSDISLEVPPVDFVPQLGRTIQVAKPVIGAVNGAARAGGFLLAQNCDLLLAAEHATFAISEVKVGRGAPWAVPLVDLIGSRLAMQLLLTGEPIDAARAHQVGLVNQVVPAEQLAAAAQDLAEQIAANAPLSVRAAKATVQLAERLGRAEAFEQAERLWEPVYRSADAQEGPRSFIEKRRPQWTGR